MKYSYLVSYAFSWLRGSTGNGRAVIERTAPITTLEDIIMVEKVVADLVYNENKRRVDNIALLNFILLSTEDTP